MQRFRRLAVASTLATLALVTLGGLVRATKSGLGCGDNWPHCPGEIDRALLVESSHRFVAGLVIALIAGLAFLAWRNRRIAPRLVRPSLAALALVVIQALLGAVVVWLELKAESVVLHLATAMALLGTLLYVTAASFAAEDRLTVSTDRGVAREASFAAASVLLLLLVGSYVTGRDAGYVFGDWPLMNGGIIPA
jgi:cytochrome c oxidase assembly protein subunit 15